MRTRAHTQITLQSTVRTMAHLFTLRKFNRPSSRRTPAGSPFSLLLPPGYASLRFWVDWLIRAPTGWWWGRRRAAGWEEPCTTGQPEAEQRK